MKRKKTKGALFAPRNNSEQTRLLINIGDQWGCTVFVNFDVGDIRDLQVLETPCLCAVYFHLALLDKTEWTEFLSVPVPENKAGLGGWFIEVSEFKDITQLFRDLTNFPVPSEE